MRNISTYLDLGPVADYIDITRDILNQVDSEWFRHDLIDAATRYSVSAFAVFADQMAESHPNNFHHVYEWNRLGYPDGRLWRPVWGGMGDTINLTYDFLPSTENVPPAKGSEGRGEAVFHWKAPILEDGGRRVIRVGEKGFLAWYDTEDEEWNYTVETQIVDPSKDTAGQFTTLWNVYWTTMASDVTARDFTLPYQLKFKTTAQRLYRNITQGAPPIPRGGMKVNIKPRRNHETQVVAAIRNTNNIFSMRARAREAVTNVNRFGSI